MAEPQQPIVAVKIANLLPALVANRPFAGAFHQAKTKCSFRVYPDGLTVNRRILIKSLIEDPTPVNPNLTITYEHR